MKGTVTTQMPLMNTLAPAMDISMATANPATIPMPVTATPVASESVSTTTTSIPLVVETPVTTIAASAQLDEVIIAVTARAPKAKTPAQKKSPAPVDAQRAVTSPEGRGSVVAHGHETLATRNSRQTPIIPSILLPEAPTSQLTQMSADGATVNSTAGAILETVSSRPAAMKIRHSRQTPDARRGGSESKQTGRPRCSARRTTFLRGQTHATPAPCKKVKRGIDSRQAALGVFGIRETPEMPVTPCVEKLSTPPAETHRPALAKAQKSARASSRAGSPSDIVMEDHARIQVARVVIDARCGEATIRQHYIDRGGTLEFAGWESMSATSTVIPAGISSSPSTWDRVILGRPNTFALSLPGGETALRQDYIANDDSQVGAQLASRIIAQLMSGPASLANSIQLAMFNLYLKNSGLMGPFARLTAEDWKTLVYKSLELAAQNVPAIDEGGARVADAITSDAARMLSLEKGLFVEWEAYFGADFAQAKSGAGDLAQGTTARLMDALASHMKTLAKISIKATTEFEFGNQASMIALQWQIVAMSRNAGKVEAALEHLFELSDSGRRVLACMALALIVKISALGELPAREGAIVSRWTGKEISALIKAVTDSDYWEVASHRAFRARLTPNENAAVNNAISSSVDDPFEAIRAIDVTTDEDKFWDAVDDATMFKALLKMGMIAADTHKGAKTQSLYQ